MTRYCCWQDMHQSAATWFAVSLVYFSERLNKTLGRHWKSFAGQPYFDKHGIFISAILSAPLVADMIIILVRAITCLHVAIRCCQSFAVCLVQQHTELVMQCRFCTWPTCPKCLCKWSGRRLGTRQNKERTLRGLLKTRRCHNHDDDSMKLTCQLSCETYFKQQKQVAVDTCWDQWPICRSFLTWIQASYSLSIRGYMPQAATSCSNSTKLDIPIIECCDLCIASRDSYADLAQAVLASTHP